MPIPQKLPLVGLHGHLTIINGLAFLWLTIMNGLVKWPGLVKDDAHNRDRRKSLTSGNRPKLPQCGNEGAVHYGLWSRDVKMLMMILYIAV